MPTDTTEKRQKRAKLIADCRALLDKADEEKRAFSGDEEGQYQKLEAEAQTLADEIKAEERRNNLEREETHLKITQEEEERQQKTGEEQKVTNPRATEEYCRAFSSYLARGRFGLEPEQWRALQSDDDEQAGYLVAPEQMASGIIADVDNLMIIRQRATKLRVAKARTLGIRKRTTRLSAFSYSAEIQTPEEDSSLAYGKKILTPHHLTGRILVSRDLLRTAVESPETIVRKEMAYDSAETQEEKFMEGSGAEEPLGLFIASDDGISTSRDVSTDNTTTAITADNLIECKYTLKMQHRRKASWIFHRDGVKKISKLKDGNGQYLWQPGLRAGDPDTILGLPVDESEYVPNTFTTKLYVGILGDFKWYYIADALDIEIQRLDELKAETNQVEFIGRLKNDAMPVLEEAFVRVKLA